MRCFLQVIPDVAGYRDAMAGTAVRGRTTVPSLVSSILVLVLSVLVAPAAAGAGTTTYRNPVSAGFADTYADPSVARGPDGWWYAVGTSAPWREGEGTGHYLPISRSRDLVHWAYVGDAFTPAT